MSDKRPLFHGDSEIDQLFRIFRYTQFRGKKIIQNRLCRILGTPTEQSWKGVTELPDYKPTFPKWKANRIKDTVKHLDEAGMDLLTVCVLIFSSNF
jgi:cyclin-dependent kinase 1